MASAPDRSDLVEPLPARPNLEMQHKRAKELLRAAAAGDAAALTRIRALHPKPPADEALTLADAQLTVARGYGFASWAAMKHKIESLTRTPVERFLIALHEGDATRVRELLETHAEVRAAVNAPISYFESRPIARAKKNLPLLDLLLEYGADLNLKSAWWAGGFGLLEYDCTPEEAAPLIERGAIVDIFAAAHLGMLPRVRELVDADPSLVHARGGDGKTPLHCARTPEIAAYLVERGAELDARDVDHESTPAQYLVREAPDVVRLLVDRGAWFDIFIAIGLGDPDLSSGVSATIPAPWTIASGMASTRWRMTTRAPRRVPRLAPAAATSIAGSSTTIYRRSKPPTVPAIQPSSRSSGATPGRCSSCSPPARRVIAPQRRRWSPPSPILSAALRPGRCA